MKQIAVGFKKLNPRAILPAYQTEQAAGMDLHACVPEGETILIPSGAWKLVQCGFAIEMPPGIEAQIRSRSGLALRGIIILNSPGTIDADYRGEISAMLFNAGQSEFLVRHGDRIAQMVFNEIVVARPVLMDDLTPTTRGAGGFGHTGIGRRRQDVQP